MLNAKKEKALEEENYFEANNIKQIMEVIKRFGDKLKGMQ